MITVNLNSEATFEDLWNIGSLQDDGIIIKKVQWVFMHVEYDMSIVLVSAGVKEDDTVELEPRITSSWWIIF